MADKARSGGKVGPGEARRRPKRRDDDRKPAEGKSASRLLRKYTAKWRHSQVFSCSCALSCDFRGDWQGDSWDLCLTTLTMGASRVSGIKVAGPRCVKVSLVSSALRLTLTVYCMRGCKLHAARYWIVSAFGCRSPHTPNSYPVIKRPTCLQRCWAAWARRGAESVMSTCSIIQACWYRIPRKTRHAGTLEGPPSDVGWSSCPLQPNTPHHTHVSILLKYGASS
jgi:hypothetical protein